MPSPSHQLCTSYQSQDFHCHIFVVARFFRSSSSTLALFALFYYLRLNNNNQTKRERDEKKTAYTRKTQICIKSGFILCQAGESSAYRLILCTHMCVEVWCIISVCFSGAEAQHAFTSTVWWYGLWYGWHDHQHNYYWLGICQYPLMFCVCNRCPHSLAPSLILTRLDIFVHFRFVKKLLLSSPCECGIVCPKSSSSTSSSCLFVYG